MTRRAITMATRRRALNRNQAACGAPRRLLVLCFAVGTLTAVAAQPRLGVEVNARGFLSVQVSGGWQLSDSWGADLGLDLPILLNRSRGSLDSGRVVVGGTYQTNAGSVRLRLNSELAWVWHRQELGRYRSLQLAGDMEVLGVAAGGAAGGALLGAELGLLTWFDPAEYVLAAFEGSGSAPPEAGWSVGGLFNLRMGLTGELPVALGPLWGVSRLALGLRLQPGSVAPLFSGFPYGNLPLFMELAASSVVTILP